MSEHKQLWSETIVHQFRSGAVAEVEDSIAIEAPLQIQVEDQILAITMRTPGNDRQLAAGFLLTEGVIEESEDLAALEVTAENTVTARLASGIHESVIHQASRELFANSSCGICGKTSLDKVFLQTEPVREGAATLPSALFEDLIAQMNSEQEGFSRTGGLHGAALFTEQGKMLVVMEDVGRHNAVDKVLGEALLQEWRGVCCLVISSRAGFEIVQKAAMARVPQVVALGAATSLAVELAKRSNIRLFGFVRKGRWTQYS